MLAKDVVGKELGFQGPFGDDGVASVASSGGVLLVEALPGVKLMNVRVVVRGSGEAQIDLAGGGECFDIVRCSGSFNSTVIPHTPARILCTQVCLSCAYM